MITLEELRGSKRGEIFSLAERRGAGNVRVFGSVARGENDARSYVDFLVDLDPGRSLLDIERLRRDLGELLATEVDVVSSRGLRDRLRDRVLQDAVQL